MTRNEIKVHIQYELSLLSEHQMGQRKTLDRLLKYKETRAADIESVRTQIHGTQMQIDALSEMLRLLTSNDRNCKRNRKLNMERYESGDRPMRWVRNAMTGEWTREPMDTPWFCSVASEHYWSS